jgi:hypothetical protein
MKLIEIFRKDATGQVDLSLMREIKDEEVINNPIT